MKNEEIYALLELESFSKNVWEPACDEGYLAKILEDKGCNVRCSDIINKGYPNTQVLDFLHYHGKFNGDIITNPPHEFAKQFVEHALEIVEPNCKVVMFLRLTVLKELFDIQPKTLYVSSILFNGEAYGWYIWEKGFKGKPIIKWFK